MVANNTTAHRNVDEDINSNNDGEVEGEEESQLLFSCQCDSARTVADLLSCLRRVVTSNVSSSTWSEGGGGASGGGGNIGGSTQRTAHTQSTAAAVAVAGGTANKIQHATVYAGPNGLTFHVQHGLAKQSQCSVDLPKGLFREYFVGEEEVWLEDSDVESTTDNMTSSSSQQTGGRTKEIIHGGEFSVNLTTVLECFSVLSRNNKSVQSMTKGSNHNGSGSGGGGNKQSHNSEYAALDRVPLCMSYDRATATFHLEFLEGGHIGGSGDAKNMGGGCLVTCEVPGVAVSDDVDDGPDDDEMDNHNSLSSNNTSGLAAAFRSSPLISRAILYSDALQAAVAELYDVPGASIVQVILSKEGMELGTVGPRSEVWVNVPYHKRQTGMYVGMECYKTKNNDPFGTQSASPTLIRKYPLGAFLTGMRGLDIGCETCISVNSRGMMAIQHQVAKDGYTDTSSANVRPSFVDFIMTCIEDNDDDDEGLSQENISQGVQNDAWQNEEIAEEPTARRTNKNSRSRTRETFSSDEDEEMHRTTRRRKEKRQYDSASGSDDDEGNNAASKILGELELDNDMLSSSHRGGAVQGRKNALDDIRRRRRERQNESSLPVEESDTAAGDGALRSEDDDTVERKSSRKMRRSEGISGETNQSDDNNPRLHSLRSTAQSSSDDNDDEDGDESEPEDALDVTAEISFSKTPSKPTSSNGRRRGRSMDVDDDEAVEEEPKMMYGDTRLEFTQDGYESGNS